MKVERTLQAQLAAAYGFRISQLPKPKPNYPRLRPQEPSFVRCEPKPFFAIHR